MLFTSDIEIIKSAILYGDMKDAMFIIDRRISSLNRYKSDRADRTKQSYAQFLKNLKNVLSGNLTVDEFKGIVVSNSLDAWFSPDPSLRKEFLDSFSYFLRISMDRYDVRYPKYDEKRCDDA
jgi:hypothetical protein